MASISKHYYYSGSWRDGGTLESSNAGLGPYDGNSKIRSVFKITLDSINSDQKRSNLKIKLTISSAGPRSNFSDSIYFCLTNSSYGSDHQIQGSIYNSKSSGSFTSKIYTT
jgi:hypothetical protein